MKKMPKGAVTHIHSTAAVNVDFLIKYTKEPEYWYGHKNKDIIYSHESKTGYTQIAKMRQEHGDAYVEQLLRDALLLTREEASSGESEAIWDFFQYKFIRLNDIFSLEGNFKLNME